MLTYIILSVSFIIIIILLTIAFSASKIPTMKSITVETFPFPVYIINLDRHIDRYQYITTQLDNMGITGYQRFPASDGFKISSDELTEIGISTSIKDLKGIAGCAASHVRLWRYIVENKLEWTLILEDDSHFHPDFMKLFPEYWKSVPQNAEIIYPGYLGTENNFSNIISSAVVNTNSYMLSWEGAQDLLNNVLPIKGPIDDAMRDFFKKNERSYVFNGNVSINGIRPNDYKEARGEQCMFNGIVYQNRKDYQGTMGGN